MDGLRAVAAFLVVLDHCGVWSVAGGFGVLAFFVLSGFLITWRLLEEDEAAGTVSLRGFYVRRMLRIFPPFYAYWLLLTVTLLLLDKRIVWPQSIASLLYVNNYYQAIFGDPNTGLSHTWSLAVEEQFYLLWPPVFLLLRADRDRMAKALMAGVGLVWVHRLLIRFVLGVGQGYVYEAFDTRADHLMIGCLLAVVLRYEMFPRFWGAVCVRPAAFTVPAALLACSLAAQTALGHAYRDGAGFVFDPLLTAVVLAQLIAFRDAAAFRWLDTRPARYLGRISYSTYLYQQVMIGPALRALSAFPAVIQIPGAIAGVLAAASVSHFAVERPFLHGGRKLVGFLPEAGPSRARESSPNVVGG